MFSVSTTAIWKILSIFPAFDDPIIQVVQSNLILNVYTCINKLESTLFTVAKLA